MAHRNQFEQRCITGDPRPQPKLHHVEGRGLKYGERPYFWGNV